MEKQYSSLLNRIGVDRLLHLPEEVKEVLKRTTDLSTKVKLLTAIAEKLGV